MYKDVQRTNVNEVFGWAVVGRPSRAGTHRRDGTRRLCLLPETELAYIIHTNRLQTRSRDASASLAFHTQQRAEQPRTPAAHANIMRSPTTAPPTRFSPRQRPDGSTCATFCAARCTQAPEYSSNQKGFTFSHVLLAFHREEHVEPLRLPTKTLRYALDLPPKRAAGIVSYRKNAY